MSGFESFGAQIAPHGTSVATAGGAAAPGAYLVILGAALSLALVVWWSRKHQAEDEDPRQVNKVSRFFTRRYWQARRPRDLRGDWWGGFERDFHAYVQRSARGRQDWADRDHQPPPRQ